MERDLKIEFDWLGPVDAANVDAMTFAAVKIEINGLIATQVEDTLVRTVRPHIHVSAYDMAYWLASKWWRLRWEPRDGRNFVWHSSHNLASIGGGYVWPHLEFSCDGETVQIEARSSSPSGTEPIRYLNTFEVSVDADSFEREIMAFIEAVVARIAQLGVIAEEDPLSTLWTELTRETKEQESFRWRKLEAMLGFDADEGPDSLLEGMYDMARQVGEAAMEEVAAISKQNALEDLQRLWNETRNHGARLRIESFPAAVAESVPHFDGGRRALPWQRGESLAREVRNLWGLTSSPLTNTMLAERLGMTEDFIVGSAGLSDVPIPAGFRNGQPGELEVAINKRHPNSRRFALARIIGDFLNPDVHDHLLPVTGTRTARQKQQRAFAQEFLCPFEHLQEYFGSRIPSEDEIDDASSYFQVSPRLVLSTLVNKGVLDRSSLDVV